MSLTEYAKHLCPRRNCERQGKKIWDQPADGINGCEIAGCLGDVCYHVCQRNHCRTQEVKIKSWGGLVSSTRTHTVCDTPKFYTVMTPLHSSEYSKVRVRKGPELNNRIYLERAQRGDPAPYGAVVDINDTQTDAVYRIRSVVTEQTNFHRRSCDGGASWTKAEKSELGERQQYCKYRP